MIGDTESIPRLPGLSRLGRPAGALLRSAGADRAAALAVMSRVWMLLATPLTLVLIGRFFTPEVQGFYYTFASLMALQSFVELGFNIVIINISSHEWSRLGLDDEARITGDPAALSRLVSLGRLVFKWYAGASLCFAVGVGVLGYVFFSGSAQAEAHWQAPWVALVVLTSLLLWALPFNALLEGCGQVSEVNRFRLGQAVMGSLALWTTISLGGGLWASVVWVLVSLLRDLYLLRVQYRRFFDPFFRPPSGPRVCWRTEIWPMQWRIGLSGVVNYLAFSLYTPVMFQSHGAAVAGRMGMTLSAVFGLQSVTMAWVQTKAPRFGALVARREYAALDRLFLSVSCASGCLLALGCAALWLLVLGLNHFEHPFAGRLLSPLPTGLFLLGLVLHQVSACQSTYLRAHKREPIALLSVTSSVAIGLLVWLVGGRFGPVGAAASYLGVFIVVVVWETRIWLRSRAEWHQT